MGTNSKYRAGAAHRSPLQLCSPWCSFWPGWPLGGKFDSDGSGGGVESQKLGLVYLFGIVLFKEPLNIYIYIYILFGDR